MYISLLTDRPGLRQIDQVEKIQGKLTESLQNMINTNHKEDGTLFAKLVMKTTDLRTLNALHAEKTVGKTFIAKIIKAPLHLKVSNKFRQIV